MNNGSTGRIVLTGAAGRLGRIVRPELAAYASDLISSDVVDVGPLHPNEQFALGELSDLVAMAELFTGAHSVVHFGGISNQRPFQELLHSNILGTHNVFEAARQAGVARVVYASSNHAVGFYPTDHKLDPNVAYRPDSQYGVSKAFGEIVGRLYNDRYGLEVVCLRIGSCTERPTKLRHLSTWLSHGDLVRLVLASLEAQNAAFEIVYGVSNNTKGWWINSGGAIPYRPQDSADVYAEQIGDHDESEFPFQGGSACYREMS